MEQRAEPWGGGWPGAPYNLVAAFPSEQAARAAADRLQRAGVPQQWLRLHPPGDLSFDEVAELRAEMQDEVDRFVGGASMTRTQARGALEGAALAAAGGALVGAVAGLVWAYGFESALSPLARLVTALAGFGAAGAVAGFVAGGSLAPRLEAGRDPSLPLDDRRLVAERDWLVALHADREQVVEEAALLLRELGAERVDLVNADGEPLPPQHDHPRPADPPGRWWWRGHTG